MADFAPNDVLDLPYGMRLRAVGLSGRTGQVERVRAGGGPSRGPDSAAVAPLLARAGMPEDAAATLGAVVEQAGMRREQTLPLSDLAPRAASRGTRAPGDQPRLELRVAAPPDGEGQVVLEVDGTGLARWHVPQGAVTAAGTDRAGGAQVFHVPVETIPVPGAAATDRSLVGFGVRKVLHFLRYPLQRAGELAGEAAVQWWERKFRPYGLYFTTPETFPQPAKAPGVTPDRLAELGGEPFLLFVHGAFSTCRTGFGGLAADMALLRSLHERYQGRVLVFDHPTVHARPEANARELLDRLPAGQPVTVDILTHSRGGLVARHLARPELATAAGRPAPVIRRLLHVATPNAGTVLARKDRLTDLLDVVTNALSLLPDETVTPALEGVVEVVKQFATGVLDGLDGLAAMDPNDPGLQALNATEAPAGTCAVTSDFAPASSALAVRALDVLVDRFFGATNDLVVPTDSVHAAGRYTIPSPILVPQGSAVSHFGYFRDPGVRAQLAALLA